MSTLVLAGDFGCGEQKDCLTVTTQFDSCTKKYTVCLSWVNCAFKSSSDSISHVCSTAYGTGPCNDVLPWGDVCLGKEDSWPANTPVCVIGEPGGYVNFGVKDGSACANSADITAYNVLGGYPGLCVADSSTSGTPDARSHFEDCVGGNNQECLWVFPVPPCPTEYPPCTTTTTSTSTTTTPCVTETKYVTVTKTDTETVNQPTTTTQFLPTTLTQGTTTTQTIPTTITDVTTFVIPTTQTIPTTITAVTTVVDTTTQTIPTTITGVTTVVGTVTQTIPTTITGITTVVGTVTQTIPTTITGVTTIVDTTTQTIPTTITGVTTVVGTVTQTVPITNTVTQTVPTTVTNSKTQTITVTKTTTPAATTTAKPPLCGKVYCGPNAECLPKCKSGPVCRCKPGYWGPNCTKYDRNMYPICKSLGCGYGNCIANGRSCKCSCFKGYSGTRCV